MVPPPFCSRPQNISRGNTASPMACVGKGRVKEPAHASKHARQRKRARCGETMLPFAVGRETREGGTRTRESAVKGKSFVIYTHAMYVRKGERTTEHSYGIRRRGRGLAPLFLHARRCGISNSLPKSCM